MNAQKHTTTRMLATRTQRVLPPTALLLGLGLGAVGCGSASPGGGDPTDLPSTEKSEIAQLPMNGPPNLNIPIERPPTYECETYESFGSDPFEQQLRALGCTLPREVSVSNGDAWLDTFCPPSGTLTELLAQYANVSPYYSAGGNGSYRLCETSEPASWYEVSYDPNCSGGKCVAAVLKEEPR